jgi:serine/threonine protein kinase
MNKDKNIDIEEFDDNPLDEASLDHESYVTASDLQSDSDEESMPTISMEIDSKTIKSELDEHIENLTLKPEGKYKFMRSIGFGGMKAVLQVGDKDTTRKVAMAIIPDFDERPKGDINRFIREARITARLEHPNIVPIHDIGTDLNGSPYFTMKYLRGHSLAVAFKNLNSGDPEALAKYTLPRLLRTFVKVANGMAFAHSKEIIHLDLKPENIHLGEFGEVLILDWGLAKFIGKEEDFEDVANVPDEFKTVSEETQSMMTLDGVAKGTPGYMAPEQAAGKNKEKDERTDIYALGCILYAILTFENPLGNRRDIRNMLHDTVIGNIESPSQLKNPKRSIPPRLERICLKAMDVLPDARYQSVYELRTDIFSFMGGFATKAENASTIKKTYLFVNRNWLPVLFGTTLLALLILIAILIFAYKNNIITVNT